MRRFEVRVVGAILLIGVGILFLLQNLGVLGASSAILWALLFAVGGAVFFYVFLTDRTNWWAVIPGFVLLGIAGLIALSELAPEVEGAWGGALFLGCIGLRLNASTLLQMFKSTFSIRLKQFTINKRHRG